MSPDTAPTAQLLHAGLRVIAPRYTVLEWLSQHPHTAAEEVGSGVQQWLGTISKQAVYDVLDACDAAGPARQIEPAGHLGCLERRTDDDHHHLVCHSCGAIVVAECPVASRLCLSFEDDWGFVTDEAELMFWGTCATCLASLGETSDRTSATRDRALDGRRIHAPTEV